MAPTTTSWPRNIPPIDLVVVNLYPFEATVARPDCSLEDAVENIDIGGPTMVRAAAKNHRDVAIVVSAGDYERVLDELATHDGTLHSPPVLASLSAPTNTPPLMTE